MGKALLLLLAPILSSAQVELIAAEWKNDPALDHASIGYCVRDARTGEIISELNSQIALIPASTLKVVTTSAAIGLLGKNFRFETRLYHTGSFNKETGVIDGDLIISGNGDPTLQSENYSYENVTDKWAAGLRTKGINVITGKIIGDASAFERSIPDTWIWGDIGNYFGAVPCALTYHDNKFSIVYTTGAPGTMARVLGTEPPELADSITITSNVTAKGTGDEAYVYGDPFSRIKWVKGTLPPQKKKYAIGAALPDPALACARAFESSLTSAGIKCNGGSVSCYQKTDTAKKHLLYLHFSPTLDKVIYHTNMQSNNLYCESILTVLGHGNMRNGIDAVYNYHKLGGMDTDGLFMADGSGLSRASTASTAFLSQLLCNVYNDSIVYPHINRSLPVAGRHGSMSNIGKGTAIENNLRAKTGYLNRARGYCGYLRARSGRELAFSILLNNYNCTPGEARLKLEKFMVALAGL
jgi:D-alanyl-D-alanine carboxypeptidase/D-alanyl-D-alanine-endopeptidase (penicillin-binding protein 4)